MGEHFFTELDRDLIHNQLGDILQGSHGGELFLEHLTSETLLLSDHIIKNASYDISSGFGLRSVHTDAASYVFSCDVTTQQLKEAGKIVRNIIPKNTPIQIPNKQAPKQAPKPYYQNRSPLIESDFAEKTQLLAQLDHYARSQDHRVRQVTISISTQYQYVEIIQPDAPIMIDQRPLTRLNVSIIVEVDGRMEQGSYGFGGRNKLHDYLTTTTCEFACDEALRQALVNLKAMPAPSGELPVVLGAGWPGVLLHEAVGHGLEGDFNRKKTSLFSGKMGKKVAAKGVTVIDDGSLEGRRGSIYIDDEGTFGARNILIEDGVLTGYMQDKMNARLMSMQPTGNGRRESFQHLPMPRMTNTFMANGNHNQQEMIESIQQGIFAVNFGGGQVDITSGQFVFSCTEAYKIENGKVTTPIKGATLIGNGIDVMNKISMIGNDLQLDTGIGMCGKNAQSVPVGVGQPSLKINSLAIGGTEFA